MLSSQYAQTRCESIFLPIHNDRTLFPTKNTWKNFEHHIPYVPNEIVLVMPTCSSGTESDIKFNSSLIKELYLDSHHKDWLQNNKETDINTKFTEEVIKPSCAPKVAIEKIDFEEKVNQMIDSLDHIQNPDCIVIKKSVKAMERRNGRNLSRSRYIGVTLKRNSWQALIWVNKKKIYIGSYRNEKDAALAFDFYSIILHGFRATTNFDFKKDAIIKMISNYIQNGRKFNPISFK